jgi:integrase
MSSIAIVFRKDKLNKSDKAPINIRITKKGKIRYFSTGHSVNIKDWDFEKSKVKTSYPNSARLNNILSNLLTEYDNKLLEVESKQQHISMDSIKTKIKNKDTTLFFTYAKKYITRYEAKGKISSYRRSSSILGKLSAYCKQDNLVIEELDFKFLNDYENYLRTQLHNKNSTIHTNIKLIKTVILSYIKEGNMSYDKNPFLNYKIKPNAPERDYLSEEELFRIESLELKNDSGFYHHRNIYVFSAYAGGLRISDVLQLKWENFDGKKLSLRIQKTAQPLSIKIPNKAIQIIRLYHNNDSKPEDFIFPLLRCVDVNNELELFRAISSATAYTNSDLKDIAKLAGINKKISFHTARHTFATRALQKGMRIEYVSKFLGHKDIRETQVYAKIINKELDDAIEIFN